MKPKYIKLYSSIVRSSVWKLDDDTRIVWITLLTMSNKYGQISSTVHGLAHKAQVSINRTEKALRLFLNPDKNSSYKNYEGRRISEIDGGWMLLDYENHAVSCN